jgi:HAE1 family hydrophobic/amphiphilic exporter-1/multidrug efflux pump
VVDDGIVVTENIFSKFEKGMPIRQAAGGGKQRNILRGYFYVYYLAVVFLPVIFLEGLLAGCSGNLAVTLAAAVLISALVSLTITPVLNVVLSRKKAGHGKFYDRTEPFFTGMENGYQRWLAAFLK